MGCLAACEFVISYLSRTVYPQSDPYSLRALPDAVPAQIQKNYVNNGNAVVLPRIITLIFGDLLKSKMILCFRHRHRRLIYNGAITVPACKRNPVVPGINQFVGIVTKYNSMSAAYAVLLDKWIKARERWVTYNIHRKHSPIMQQSKS